LTAARTSSTDVGCAVRAAEKVKLPAQLVLTGPILPHHPRAALASEPAERITAASRPTRGGARMLRDGLGQVSRALIASRL
jgi:hypothetical protein